MEHAGRVRDIAAINCGDMLRGERAARVRRITGREANLRKRRRVSIPVTGDVSESGLNDRADEIDGLTYGSHANIFNVDAEKVFEIETAAKPTECADFNIAHCKPAVVNNGRAWSHTRGIKRKQTVAGIA